MYIEPNSTIMLLKNVPLDNKYNDTIFFDNWSQQYQHFTTYYDRRTYSAQSYQRKSKGVIRLNAHIGDIYNCNYLMFINTSYEDKWFYAFITNIEYVNNEVCEISYELDVMQTWHFNYTMGYSFVERETSASDVIGGNLQDEPVDLGPVICYTIDKTGFFNSYDVIAAYARNYPVLEQGV